MSLNTPKRYLGVTFMKRVVGAKRWRSQIVRQGVILFLGCFESPDEAARVYDNASYHLANWGETSPQYNFPLVWTGENVPPPSEFTLKALARLKEKFPNWEREMAAEASLSEMDKLERDGLIAAEATNLNMTRVRTALTLAFSRIKMQQVAINAHAEELAARDRIIASLRITGGKSYLKPVNPLTAEGTGDPV